MIQGEIRTFLDALSAREGEERLDRALALVGGRPEIEVYDDDIVEKYLNLPERGVTFLLNDGQLDTVFVYAAPKATKAPYPGWPTLIDDVAADSSRDDVQQVLGTPIRSTNSYLTYAADPGFVQFEFDGAALSMVVVMRELIGGPTPASTPAEQAPRTATTLDGEIVVFMRALGRPMFSPEHFTLLGLTGPASDSYDEERGGVIWQYDTAPRVGVTLQFKEETLVGALIRLASDEEEPTYPTADQLIDGLPLPSTREAVREHLGDPDQSSESLDLYLIDGCYLRFDFSDGRGSALTVILPGIEA
jgi:hypothetical protein